MRLLILEWSFERIHSASWSSENPVFAVTIDLCTLDLVQELRIVTGWFMVIASERSMSIIAVEEALLSWWSPRMPHTAAGMLQCMVKTRWLVSIAWLREKWILVIWASLFAEGLEIWLWCHEEAVQARAWSANKTSCRQRNQLLSSRMSLVSFTRFFLEKFVITMLLSSMSAGPKTCLVSQIEDV